MFLHLRVILFTGGGGSGQPPLDTDPPGLGKPPLDADPPLDLGRNPWMQNPMALGRPPWVGQTPLGWADPPMQTTWVWQTPLDADPPSIGQTPSGCRLPPGLGRPPSPDTVNKRVYASYWNAYLFIGKPTCIGWSRRMTSGIHAHSRTIFAHFHAGFREKVGQIIRWYPYL